MDQGKYRATIMDIAYRLLKGYQSVGQPPYASGMAAGEGYLPPFLMGSPASAKSVRLSDSIYCFTMALCCQPHGGFSSNYRHPKTTPILNAHPQHYGPMTDTTNLAISHKCVK